MSRSAINRAKRLEHEKWTSMARQAILLAGVLSTGNGSEFKDEILMDFERASFDFHEARRTLAWLTAPHGHEVAFPADIQPIEGA